MTRPSGLQIGAKNERMLIEKPLAGVRALTSSREGSDLIDRLAGATGTSFQIPTRVAGREAKVV